MSLSLKWLSAAVIGVVLFVVLYFAAVLVGGIISVGGDTGIEKFETALILDNNGRHFDIWIPARYCEFLSGGNVGVEDTDPEADTGWYGFGWGDRAFFLNTPYAGDLKPGLLLNALFLPSRSVLAVQYSPEPPSGVSATRIKASDGQLTVVSKKILSRFQMADSVAAEGIPLLLPVPQELVHPSYRGYSFYESRGHYTLFFTSNNWVNSLLKSAGIPTGLWTPFVFGLIKS